MPRNGSGTYQLPAGQPVVTGTVISSSTFNTLTTDLANALTQSISKDGQTPPTANLPMGGFKLTGLGNGSASTDSITYGQVQNLISADRKSRNRIINGGFGIDQRNNGAALTITAGAALLYTVDRWYAYSTGANVTAQQGAASGPGLGALTITGAASVTGVGIGQRIERADSFDLANTTATLSVYLSNSLVTLPSVNWALYYANTNNTFGTLASPTRTLISSGTFTVTSSLARYTASVSIPVAATTGLEVVFTVGAQTSGLLVVAGAQLEKGTAVSDFEQLSIEETASLCQRYFQSTRTGGLANMYPIAPALTANRVMSSIQFPVSMRATPAVVIYAGTTATTGKLAAYNASGTAIAATSGFAPAGTYTGGYTYMDGAGSALTIGDWYVWSHTADAEL